MASTFMSAVQSQSLNGVVAGFSFASALAWLDVARWIISMVVKVPKTSGLYVVLSALLITILSVVVYMVLNSISKSVREPSQAVYAVTR
jgi:hypothetical protein